MTLKTQNKYEPLKKVPTLMSDLQDKIRVTKIQDLFVFFTHILQFYAGDFIFYFCQLLKFIIVVKRKYLKSKL